MRTVIVSGGYDPLHIGHLYQLRDARKLGNRLIVVLNSDQFLLKKKGYIFMPFEERLAILKAIKYVDKVVPCIDKDMSVCETLMKIRKDVQGHLVFAKGGDRTKENIPELTICEELGIQVCFGVGGDKIQSSSELVKAVKKRWGFYKILLRGKGFWVKQLHFDKGSTSLQTHAERDEFWLISVPRGVEHKLSGQGDVLEVAIGNPRERDITRISEDNSK